MLEFCCALVGSDPNFVKEKVIDDDLYGRKTKD